MSSRLSSRTGCRSPSIDRLRRRGQRLPADVVVRGGNPLHSTGDASRRAALLVREYPDILSPRACSAGASPVSVRRGLPPGPPGPSSRTARSSSCSWPSRRAARRGRRSPRCGWRRPVSRTWRSPRPARRSGRASPCRRPTPTRPSRPTWSRSRCMPFRASPRIRSAIRSAGPQFIRFGELVGRVQVAPPETPGETPPDPTQGSVAERARAAAEIAARAGAAGPGLDGDRRRAADAGRLHAVRPSRSRAKPPTPPARTVLVRPLGPAPAEEPFSRTYVAIGVSRHGTSRRCRTASPCRWPMRRDRRPR